MGVIVVCVVVMCSSCLNYMCSYALFSITAAVKTPQEIDADIISIL